GKAEEPLDALSLALGAGATFVARAVDRDKQGLPAVLRAAAEHPGAALVEVLQNCPVFNDGAYDHVAGADRDANRIPLEHGRPIVFGPDGERCVTRAADGTLVVADTSATDPGDLVVHDAHRADPGLAFALAQLGDLADGPVPLGVFRSVDAPPWGDGLVAAARAARERVGDAELDELLHA